MHDKLDIGNVQYVNPINKSMISHYINVFFYVNITCRSSRPYVFCKKNYYRNFTKFTGKHLCQSLFFNKVSGLRLATLFEKRLWHMCFPVNFVKFLRTPFYIEYFWWLLFPRLSLYILLLPCHTILEILLLSQKVVFLLVYAERHFLY